VNAGFEYREQIGPQTAGRTVLTHLSERYRHSSGSTWESRIAAGEVSIEGALAAPTDVLRAGSWLVWRRPPWEEPLVPLAFAVLYRDEHLLAVAKPRGLPALPNGGFLTHTLLHLVNKHFPDAVPMHRLDRGTSGLMLFALTPPARREVAAAWREGGVEKLYRALVSGTPSEATFTIDKPIGPVPHPRLGHVHAVSPGGKPALTQVRVIRAQNGTAVVEVNLATGRPHQIRIHLAAAGHPLVGDSLYASGGLLRDEPGLPGDPGYRLHAHRLSLTHPITQGRLELECSPPEELR
jgi:23S rRNA pseudouridine1911/1915/1917 synthase